MPSNKSSQTWFVISIISYFIMSCSFMIMPLDNYSKKIDTSIINIISGACFWLFLIIGCVGQVLVSRHRKASIANREIKSRIGILGFFGNKWARIADCIMIAALVVFVISLIITKAIGYVCYVSLSATIFFFCMHCILNGRNYLYITD